MAVTWTAEQHQQSPGDIDATLDFPSAIKAGSLLIAASGYGGAGTTPTTPVDSKGNTWNLIRRVSDATNDQAASWWYAISNGAGADTVTFVHTSFDVFLIAEFSVDTGTISPDMSAGVPVETGQVRNHTNASDNITSGPVTTQGVDRLLVSFNSEDDASVTLSAGTGFTIFGVSAISGFPGVQSGLEYGTLAAAGSASGLWTGDASGRGMCFVAAFKSSASDITTGLAWIRA